MLQFITNTACGIDVTDQVRQVLEGGCEWIQLRMKDASDDSIRKVVEEIKPMCKENEAILILDDRVELAKELELDGVHLGKSDMPPSKARLILGAGAIIGVTANTFEDIELVRALDIDYIGIGPFRYTTTKSNLSPVLGLEKYSDIIKRMHSAGIEIATVAIGGITTEDVASLIDTGVNGVAVSGAIANADDIKAETTLFLEKLADANKQ